MSKVLFLALSAITLTACSSSNDLELAYLRGQLDAQKSASVAQPMVPPDAQQSFNAPAAAPSILNGVRSTDGECAGMDVHVEPKMTPADKARFAPVIMKTLCQPAAPARGTIGTSPVYTWSAKLNGQ